MLFYIISNNDNLAFNSSENVNLSSLYNGICSIFLAIDQTWVVSRIIVITNLSLLYVLIDTYKREKELMEQNVCPRDLWQCTNIPYTYMTEI